jgi:hypothetical protein
MSIRDLRAVLFACLLAGPVEAADHAPLFADNAVLDVRIEAPIGVLMDVRPDEAYLKGTFTLTGSDGLEVLFPLKLRTRGNYRRDKSHCDFAPIRLNFRKNDVYDTLLAGQDKLKLVTHCRTDEYKYENYLLREYLAYRLFAALSNTSYRVRLLRVTYIDTQDASDLTRYGFVIEDDKAVRKRNGLKNVKVRQVGPDDHDASRQNLVHVFEYMIGNTEYSLTSPEPGKNCCHNMDLASANKEPPYIALPFDFDFSGLVDAEYAEPNPRYPIKTVSTRFYKGLCKNNALLPETLDQFQSKREELFAIIDEIAAIDKKTARAMRPARSYIEKFYKVIDDPDKVREQLTEGCNDRS